MGGRRVLVLLTVLALLAVPAGALRAACAGRSCASDEPSARVPFCPLPDWMKTDIAAGYREGRSPDVLGVAARPELSAAGVAPWPSVADGPSATRVPLAFWGAGVDPSARIPSGTTLDAVAPTIAEAIGLRRKHPDVRSGEAIDGVANGERPALVVLVALTGLGGADVAEGRRAWPALEHLLRSGAGTTSAETGSLPLDPVATLTTIGTGGLPAQHGMTGALIRNDGGRVVPPWGPGSPPSVIATLGDDLDEATHGRARIGLVAPTFADRGLIGGTWYPGPDDDDVAILGDGAPRDPTVAARDILSTGYGGDGVPDVLGVVLDGRDPSADDRLRALVAAAVEDSPGSAMVVVAGTGATTGAPDGVPAVVSEVEDEVPGDGRVVAGVVPGGMFLDQGVMAAQRISGQTVVDALLDASDLDGRPLFEDAFQGFAVSFARYCS